jgi:hypothetical protein
VTVDKNDPAGGDGCPYYLNPTEVASQVQWDPNSMSGTLQITDGASVSTQLSSSRFEVYIIATNYNNSSQDQILGSFTWGYSNYGLNSVTGTQIIFQAGSCISPIAQQIISTEYPMYKFYGQK